MSTATPAEIALIEENRRLYSRIAELERERQIPKEIIEKSPVMISIVRAPDFVYELVNPAFQALAPGKEFLGRRFADVWSELPGPLVENLQDVIATGQTLHLEDAPYTIQRGPGMPPEVVYVSYSWIPLFDPEGKPDRVLTLAHEVTGAVRQRQQLTDSITELREAEKALRESEERFRVAQELSPDGFLIFRPLRDDTGAVTDFLWIYENDAAARMNDTNPKEIYGKRLSEVLPHHDESPFHKAYKEVAETGEVRIVEDASYDQDTFQQRRWFRVAAVPTSGGDVASLVQNVTERKRAEEALRESEAVLRGFFDSPGLMRGIVEIADGAIVHVSCNEAAAELYGIDRESISGKSVTEPGAPEDVARAWGELYEKSRLTGDPASMEYARRGAEGVSRWMLATASYLGIGPSGNPRFAYTIFDLTEHRRIVDALNYSQKRLEVALESAELGTWEVDIENGLVTASERTCAMFGFGHARPSVEEWVARLHPDDRERVGGEIREAIAGGCRYETEYRVVGLDGSIKWVFAKAGAAVNEQGRATHLVGVAQDITRRKQSEQALARAYDEVINEKNRLHAVMESLPLGVALLDAKGGNITANPAYEQLWGSPRPPTGSISDYGAYTAWWVASGQLVQPEEWASAVAVQKGETVVHQEIEIQRFDGARAFVLNSAAPIRDANGQIVGSAVAIMDITAHKKMEKRLRESQKLESLGLLAGGVAHDFNNLLVGVIGNASLAQEMLPPDHPVADLLAGVLKTGEQAAHLTRQMLAYSGKGKFLVEPLNLSALIRDMCGLVRSSISKKIELRLDLEEDLPGVEADRGQVQQVFMNLAINAAEAIGSEGLITVGTGVQDVDEPYLRLHPELAALAPGRYVCLEVRDTGSGMDEATKAKIFDPFFSTRFTGRGLGLAAVSGILRGHKSGITVSSAPGKGSCFTVLFPAATRATGKGQVVGRDASLQGAGTVLVVDDEQVVRELAKRALERHGYTVLMADSGSAAIDVFRRHPGEIALVVLDLSMPNMSGEEALPELRKIRPGVKVVVSSGYSESEAMPLFDGQRVSGFVQKPYTSKGIAEKVKECLG